jgi:hypothetical protein
MLLKTKDRCGKLAGKAGMLLKTHMVSRAKARMCMKTKDLVKRSGTGINHVGQTLNEPGH